MYVGIYNIYMDICTYPPMYTYIHTCMYTCNFWVYMHTVPWIDIQTQHLETPLVFPGPNSRSPSLQWMWFSVSVGMWKFLGFMDSKLGDHILLAGDKHCTVPDELLLFFLFNQERCVVTFSVARLSFEILLSCKIWIEAYCWRQFVLWGLSHRSLNHESNPGRISYLSKKPRRLLWMGWRWEISMMIEGLCRDWIVVQNMESCLWFPLRHSSVGL